MRNPRGHVLMEALVAGAVVLVAISGIATATVQAARDSAIARDDQEAWSLAEAQLEQLQALSLTAAAWTVGVTGPAAIAGHPNWTLTLTITDVADPSTAGVTLRRARVDIDYRASTRQVQLETARWLAPPA